MKLVLVEKPLVVQSIAKVLCVSKREGGYLEGNGYIVRWCVSHLVELAQPGVYWPTDFLKTGIKWEWSFGNILK